MIRDMIMKQRKRSNNRNKNAGAALSVTQSSTVTSSSSSNKNNAAKLSITGIAIFGSRLGFIFMLSSVATSFGYLSYYLLTQSEHQLTEVQFESIADRAMCSAKENFERKRLGVISLASVVGGANPSVEDWPNAVLNNYEAIASNLIDTSKGCNMAFAPIVHPNQIAQFEEFAYDYYEQTRQPEPFPIGTANSSSFGKGIWSMDMSLDIADKRYHDITGETSYGSPNQIVTPMFQHNQGPSKKLMMNLHFNPMLGGMIDDMLECAQNKVASNSTDSGSTSIDDCTAITTFKDNSTSWIQKVENGPGANIMQPIYPSNDPTKTMTGIIISQIVWGEIMVDTYAKGVNGIDIVLTDNTYDENGTMNYYTYHVVRGETKLVGKGDLHDTKFDRFGSTHNITSEEMLGETSALYTMTLYPTRQLYDVYTTKNPTVASLGCVLIIAFTSLLFLLYDILVRKEFHAKQDLLDAKRKFVRFVSHEVRTPLNSVCMGLTLLKDEINEFKKDRSAATTGDNDYQGNDNDNQTCCPTNQWLTLTEEVAANAHSAVDVLNDFLNYDKVETGKLTLELGLVKMFDLIEKTVNEFKLPAAKKKLNLTVDTPLSSTSKNRNLKRHEDDPEECIVIGDVIRLTQVLRNLISNAVKFTPEDGTIDVRATWLPPVTPKERALSTIKYTQFELDNSSKQKDNTHLSVLLKGSLQLTVTDTGAGMTQEQVLTVFSQGSQFNVNELQAGNGSGLGTWIARGIVKQHGGSLTANSKGIDKGTTFSVSLPLYDIPKEIMPNNNTSSMLKQSSTLSLAANESMLLDGGIGDEYGTLKILVVDDAKMNLKLLMKLLEKEGHAVDGAEDGLIAVEKTKAAMDIEQDYDVILMDYQMPNMDGPTAARTIRELGCYAFIVGVTGNIMPEDVIHFKNHGANAVLPKPIKIQDLKELWMEYGVRGSSSINGRSMQNITFDLESIRTVVEEQQQQQPPVQKQKPKPLFSLSSSRTESTNISRVSMTGELVSSSSGSSRTTSSEEMV